jgi:hypothetical protein
LLHSLEYKFSLLQLSFLYSLSRSLDEILISSEDELVVSFGVDVDGTDDEGADDEGADDDDEGTDDDALDDEDNCLSEVSKVSLDAEVSDDDSIIKGFFFSGFSFIILYIMNIIYILVILY